MQKMKITPKPENFSRWFTLIIVVTGSFMAILDTAIINIVIPTIANYFKSEIDKSEWLISGYTLSISIMLLCSGWFARKYGHKRVYIIGILIFTLGSFMCSMATSMNYLIAMRMLQGVGGGIIIPLSMSIIAHNFMGKERGLAIGLLTMSIGIAVSLGPFLGGYFVEIDKWDWVFKINIPIGVLITIMALFLMKNFKDDKVPRFDYIGVALVLIWAPLALYILSSNMKWWLILVLIISFGLFVLRMIYARNPLINIHIFKNRNFVLAIIVMLFLGMVLQGGNYMLSEYLLHGLHYSAYMAGIMFVPVGIIQGGMSPIVGSLTRKYGNQVFILLGLVVVLIYLYLSSRFALDTPHWYIQLTLYLRGLGIGLSLTAITNLSLDGAKSNEIDSVSGVLNTVSQLAGSFSIAIVTLIMLSKTNNAVEISKGYALASNESFFAFSVAIAISIIVLLLFKKKRTKGSL